MLTFRDLYKYVLETENAIQRMGLDAENVLCGTPACVLTEQQQKLADSYAELANQDILFCKGDFGEIIGKIQECFTCLNLDLDGDVIVPPLPDAEDSEDLCKGFGIVPLDYIRRFRVYEMTPRTSTEGAHTEVYLVPKADLPFSFVPSAQVGYESGESYHLSWNRDRHTLKMRCRFSKSSRGRFNIVKVVAELEATGRQEFGVDEITACTVFLMTPDITWRIGRDLRAMVDGNDSTYSELDVNVDEVKVEFQFKG